ncbi:MAG: ABC transporter ATP-binding protein [Niabella sp.]
MSLGVHIQDLNFNYKNQPPLIRALHFHVPQGVRFGIFGPNGAGKTTLMGLMTGLLRYELGSIKVLGYEVKDSSKYLNNLIGVVPQDFSFYEELSPIENMEFFGAWYGLNTIQIKQKTAELLTVMGLNDVRHKPVKQFSGGMKRRVNLAIGVMNDPRILFLDEPTVGVDVHSRNAIVAYLKKINEENGTTLIYTSHQLKEAEDLCQYVAMIDQGQLIAEDSIEQLLQKHHQDGLEGLFLELTGRDYRD